MGQRRSKSASCESDAVLTAEYAKGPRADLKLVNYAFDTLSQMRDVEAYYET